MDFPIGDVGTTLDEGDELEDRAEDMRYRPKNIFINVIDDEYDLEANPDYEKQDGGEEDGDKENYEEDNYCEEEPPLCEGDEVAMGYHHEDGEASHTRRTRSHVIAI